MARTPASGPSTRDRLLRAAEELFATEGVHSAQLREIVARAGQSNPSAVQYHFGSREQLLAAVMAERQARVEQLLEARLPDPGGLPLRDLLDALVRTEGTELRTARGRHGLRISAQLSHRSGIRIRVPHPGLAGTRYWTLITELERPLAELPEPVRLERIDCALTLIGAALGERARQLAEDETPLTDTDCFLAELTTMTTALLTAPFPSPTP